MVCLSECCHDDQPGEWLWNTVYTGLAPISVYLLVGGGGGGGLWLNRRWGAVNTRVAGGIGWGMTRMMGGWGPDCFPWVGEGPYIWMGCPPPLYFWAIVVHAPPPPPSAQPPLLNKSAYDSCPTLQRSRNGTRSKIVAQIGQLQIKWFSWKFKHNNKTYIGRFYLQDRSHFDCLFSIISTISHEN